ncbi:MAG: sulfatase [bacterium]|nr:sulfatase [bacterium]
MKLFHKKTVKIGGLIGLLLFFHGIHYWAAYHLGNSDGHIGFPPFLIGLSILDSIVYGLFILMLFSSRRFNADKIHISLPKIDQKPGNVFLPFTIGIICGISIGCLELIILLLISPFTKFDSFQTILLPLASATGIFFFLYVSSWFLIVFWIQRFFHLQRFPLMLASASFWMIAFLYTTVNRFVDILNTLPELYKLFFLGIFFVIGSFSIYFALKPIERNTFYHLMSFGALPPLILIEVMLWTWMKKSAILPDTSIFLPLLYAGILVLSVEFFLRIRWRINTLNLLVVVFTFILLSPFVASRMVKSSSSLLSGFSENSHHIRHVILITDDTLRPDFLSCYGSERVLTPHIDQLARDGVLFENAFSAAPWTMPSVSSIMTGLSPAVHGMKTKGSRLPDALPTLAEFMYNEGYYTSAIGRNSILTSQFNISQGFLEYHFFPKPRNSHIRGINFFQWLLPEQFRTDVSTNDITTLASNWITAHHKKDFFLWLHYFDPHQPYTPPDSTLPEKKIVPSIGKEFSKFQVVRGGYWVPSLQEREWIKELYAAEVRHVDSNIGKLVMTLKKLNLYENSLIIFTSDHGEEFWEHGGFEHGHTLYNEVLQVPLIIKPPIGFDLSPQKIDTSVSLQSILPTVLTLCDVPYETDKLYAMSLAPFSQFATETVVPSPLISSSLLYYEDREAIMFDGMKYIRSLLTNHEELFDLTQDPGEQTSIISLFPDKVLKAQDIMSNRKIVVEKQKEYYKLPGTETFDIDEDTVQHLKSLGYVH